MATASNSPEVTQNNCANKTKACDQIISSQNIDRLREQYGEEISLANFSLQFPPYLRQQQAADGTWQTVEIIPFQLEHNRPTFAHKPDEPVSDCTCDSNA